MNPCQQTTKRKKSSSPVKTKWAKIHAIVMVGPISTKTEESRTEVDKTRQKNILPKVVTDPKWQLEVDTDSDHEIIRDWSFEAWATLLEWHSYDSTI